MTRQPHCRPTNPHAIERLFVTTAKCCARCRQLKAASEFAISSRNSSGLQNWCRGCQRAYYREHRASNIARARENKRGAVTIARALLRDHLRTHPCVDCGERDPAVLDFDHLRDKRLEVTRMAIQGFARATIQAEIDKCAVRCANCHRRRTALQRRLSPTTQPPQSQRGGRRRDRLLGTGIPTPLATVDAEATRRCARCGRVLPSTEFNRSSRYECQYWCRDCQSAYYAARSAHHKTLVAKNSAVYSARNRAFVNQYLLEHPCVDCGETDVVVLEFDHLRDKRAKVSRLRRSCGLEQLRAEIAKCEVRCANCHRRKTAERRASASSGRRVGEDIGA